MVLKIFKTTVKFFGHLVTFDRAWAMYVVGTQTRLIPKTSKPGITSQIRWLEKKNHIRANITLDWQSAFLLEIAQKLNALKVIECNAGVTEYVSTLGPLNCYTAQGKWRFAESTKHMLLSLFMLIYILVSFLNETQHFIAS